MTSTYAFRGAAGARPDDHAFHTSGVFDDEPCRAVFVHAPDAMFYCSPDGRILAVNPAACRLFGYAESELVGAASTLVWDEGDPRQVEERARAQAELRRAGRFAGLLRYRRRDGSVFVGDITATTFGTSDGEGRTCAIVRDATRRAAQEAAARDEVRLETTVHERQRLADAMHDVALQQLFCASLELDRAALDAGRLATAGDPTPDGVVPVPWRQLHDEIEVAGEHLRAAIRELRAAVRPVAEPDVTA